MTWPILIFIQIAIGALIGGMTNELAIRMLFRPYKPLYIGKWRIPFTPGLIPKRHNELAYQMGKLVENFLITPDGIRKMLKKGGVEEEVTEWFIRKINELGESDDSIETILSRWGISLDENVEKVTKQKVRVYLEKKLSLTSYSTIDEILPIEIRQHLELKLGEVSPILLEKMGNYLSSDDGVVFIRQMLNQLVGGLGMFGGIANMLLSDEKVIQKVGSSLVEAFNSEALQEKVTFLVQQEIRKLYKKQISEVIEWIGEEQVENGIQLIVNQVVDFNQLRKMKVYQIVDTFLPMFCEKIPGIIRNLFSWVETHLEKGLKKINLTKIAANQVEAFPVYMLEKMIVSITGKELRMITVLGAILGGLIGAIQGGLVMWLR